MKRGKKREEEEEKKGRGKKGKKEKKKKKGRKEKKGKKQKRQGGLGGRSPPSGPLLGHRFFFWFQQNEKVLCNAQHPPAKPHQSKQRKLSPERSGLLRWGLAGGCCAILFSKGGASKSQLCVSPCIYTTKRRPKIRT